MATMNIDVLLKKYKLNQKDLADSTGINGNTISRYCNGTFKTVDKTHIDLICKYFKCIPNDLFQLDDTVDVIPAKITYYDDKKDEIAYGEIVKTIINPVRLLNPLNWGTSTKIPSDIKELIQKDNSEIIKEFNKYEWYDTMPDETKNELFNETQERVNVELEVDKLVFEFTSKIIKLFLSSPDVSESIKEILQGYDKYDYFSTGLTIKRYYRILHPFLTTSLKDFALAGLLVEINDIYKNGGLEKLSDENLKELGIIIKHYLNKDIKIKKTR